MTESASRRSRLPPPLPFSGKEVEGRKLHFPARQRRRHVLPEQGAVNGVDMLQVQLAVGAGSDFVPVYVIVSPRLMRMGFFPWTRSWVARRFAEVVLPEELGPASSTAFAPRSGTLDRPPEKTAFHAGLRLRGSAPGCGRRIRQVVEVGHCLALQFSASPQRSPSLNTLKKLGIGGTLAQISGLPSSG